MTKTSTQITLGIDPGFAITGYAVVATTNGTITPIDFGVITTKAGEPFAERLHTIDTTLENIIKKYKPQRVGVEQVYFAKNTKTAIQVAHARGIVLLQAARHSLRVFEYTPLQVKQALTSYGRADKTQIQNMLQLLFKLPEPPTPDDAADALAIAWYCSQHNS